jgi:L-idonate 5-dehydrogenase
MKKLAIHAAEDIRWDDADTPEPAGGEVRLRVKYVGICGSDLHYYFHGANGEYTIREPLTPGHELSGVVDLDPSGRLAPGTPVTVHPARYGPNVAGLENRPHLRPGGASLGRAAGPPHRQGGAAEYVIVEEGMVRVLPDGLPLERAALAEPLAVALHAVSLADSLAGRRVLVMGAGPIGLLVLAAALRAGAESISVSDIKDEALQRARVLGADELVLVGRDTVADESYDVIFECSGAPVALALAVRAARRGGSIVQLGMLPNADIAINLAPMLAKELTLRGAFRFSDEIDDAIALLAENDALQPIVTHVIAASNAVEAFTVARDASLSSKVLLAL